MNFTTDASFLMILFVLPSLFGLTLIGEGINKIMNYDNHGWINVSIGAVFVIVIILAYFMLTSSAIR